MWLWEYLVILACVMAVAGALRDQGGGKISSSAPGSSPKCSETVIISPFTTEILGHWCLKAPQVAAGLRC